MANFFRTVKISGSPHQMGVEYGRQTADLIRQRIASLNNFYRDIGYSEEKVQKIRERHEEGIGRVAPMLLEEIRGMAEGAGVKFEAMMDVSAGGDIRDGLRHLLGRGCTTCIALGRATKRHETLIGHNWDGSGQELIVVTLAKPSDGLGFVTIGPAGRPGCEGMNEKGLTIVMSWVNQRERTRLLEGTGPLFVPPQWTHHILYNCEDVNDAIERCKETFQSPIHGENWVVGDSKSAALAEVSYNQIKVKHMDWESEREDWIQSATNHYPSREMNHLGPLPEEFPNSYAREERMLSLLRSDMGRIDLDLVKTYLRDHQGLHKVCSHEETRQPPFYWKTISSEIGEPRNNRFWIAVGPPCRNEYHLFTP